MDSMIMLKRPEKKTINISQVWAEELLENRKLSRYMREMALQPNSVKISIVSRKW